MTTNQNHVFDEAIALQHREGDRWAGRTSAAYANMVGPFGGLTAAQALNGVLQNPQRQGEPVAFTVNFAAALEPGEFELVARPARTNRSTQHWSIEMRQDAQVVLTASAVCASRRETWSVDDLPMPPTATRAADTPRAMRPDASVEWIKRYEMRFLEGAFPSKWDGGEAPDSRTLVWLRDDPPRKLDFASLAALADTFFPRVWLRRAKPVPIGTVSMTTYFHAGGAELSKVAAGHVLGQARAVAFRNGYFDQSAQLWSEAGALLASSHQLVYYKE